MSRQVVSISLSPQFKKLVDKAVKSGKFASRSEFFRHLMREDEALRGLRESQKEIAEGKDKILKSLKDLR